MQDLREAEIDTKYFSGEVRILRRKLELYFSTNSDPENKLGDKPDVSSDDSDADSVTSSQSDGDNNGEVKGREEDNGDKGLDGNTMQM